MERREEGREGTVEGVAVKKGGGRDDTGERVASSAGIFLRGREGGKEGGRKGGREGGRE